MSQTKNLMADFPAVSTEKWEAVIGADLKGADYDKKLVWKTIDGFSVRPYYRAEDLTKIQFLDAKPGQYPYVRSTKSCGSWAVRQTLTVTDPAGANTLSKEYICGGAEALNFVINDKEFTSVQLDTLLDGILCKNIYLTFSGCAASHIAELFLDKVERDSCDVEQVRASFGIDPLKRASVKGSLCSNGKCFDKIAHLINRTAKYKRIRIISVGGVLFDHCGADTVQQMAFSLAMGHQYIVSGLDKGLTIDQVAPSIEFNMGVGVNYFLEIAKFRALRMLWANIARQYNPVRGCSEKMRVNATTSSWNQTIYDPHVNMLRGTTEAMSAAMGGVDSIEVLPFDHCYASPSEFSTRIARNTQLLLKEESHLDQVIDPAGGSYYIETLTNILAERAWDLFKEIESKGGYLACLKENFIQDKIAATAATRNKNLATRRDTLLGTNQYPNFNEIAPKEVTKESVSACQADKRCGCSSSNEPEWACLLPYRGAMGFEALRLTTDRCGKQINAFMLTCGSLSFARARAQFACNFFACAGIRVQDNTYFTSVDQGVKAAQSCGAQIVVICASDDDYATLAVEAHKALSGSAIVVVAGEPACRAELEAAGIKHFISVRSNLLETLKEYQKELGI